MNFKYFSLFYLNQWLSKDRRFVEGLSSADRNAQLQSLTAAANFYKVGRNLPTRFENGLRYADVLETLEALPTKATVDEIVPLIHDTAGTISRSYGNRGVLSLTTKFMWLRLRHPVIIYDAQARRALATADGDLESFYNKWRRTFETNRDQIADACSNLPGLVDYCVNPAVGREYVASIAAELWFHERVLDVQLWSSQAKT